MNLRIKILLLSLLTLISVSAQVARTALNGIVTDEQGKRIPSAKVRATNTATGSLRETETNASGAYMLPDMETGTFAVEIAKDGFAPRHFGASSWKSGKPRTLDVTLDLAGHVEEMNVTEAEFQLDRVDATVGAPIEQKQVDELPINGSNWSTLTALVPGAVDNGAGDQRTIRFAGHGLDDNNLTLDGVDATAVYNQMQREYVRLTIPLESIEQFDVKDQTFGADVEGGTAGGQVAVVSPSGTNAFHGNVFDYFRNDAMEARTPFNGASPNPFLLNQFGAGVGGPICRTSCFSMPPTKACASGWMEHKSDSCQVPAFIAQAGSGLSGSCSDLAGLSRRDFADFEIRTSGTTMRSGRQIDNEDSGMIRLDYHFSEKTTAVRALQLRPGCRNDTHRSTSPRNTIYDTKFNNGEVELLHVFTPTLVNEVKFGINQDFYHAALFRRCRTPSASLASVPSLAATTSDNPSKAISVLDDGPGPQGDTR